MLKKLKKKKNNKGFTLVELLVVIAIIGILAVVAVPSLMKNINRAKATDVISYVSAVKTAAISEYAGGNEDVTVEEINALIDDIPNSIVSLKTITIDEGKITNIAIIIKDSKLSTEVQNQANSSFGSGFVTVSAS